MQTIFGKISVTVMFRAWWRGGVGVRLHDDRFNKYDRLCYVCVQYCIIIFLNDNVKINCRFTSNEKCVLVASDVAARGLDLPQVHHVVHYQVPRNTEVLWYCHDFYI